MKRKGLKNKKHFPFIFYLFAESSLPYVLLKKNGTFFRSFFIKIFPKVAPFTNFEDSVSESLFFFRRSYRILTSSFRKTKLIAGFYVGTCITVKPAAAEQLNPQNRFQSLS